MTTIDTSRLLLRPFTAADIRVMEKAGMRRDPDLMTIEGVQAVRCVLRAEDWRASQEE